MIQNKAEIRAYFELHSNSAKEVAKKFNVNYRTLAHWIKTESWQKGKAIAKVQGEVITDELTNHKIDTFLGATKSRLKREVRQEMSLQARDIDELVLNNLLESSTDEILLKAMSLNFIQKNLSLTAIIAKDELMRMLAKREDNKTDPMIIACAEKVAKMLIDLKSSLYGKEASIIDTNNQECDITKLSTAELIKMLENES